MCIRDRRSGDETEIPDEIPCFDAANIVEPHADAYVRADAALLCDYAEYYPSLDCLLTSRACIEPPVSADEWIREQATDEFCQNAKRDVETEPQSRFHLSPDGILMRTAPLDGATQIVVPEAIKGRILRANHYAVTAGHPGARRMYDAIRRAYYWPMMSVDVYTTVRQCDACARNRVTQYRHTNALKLFPATRPLEDVAIDILGPLPETPRQRRFVLVIADRYSKLCRLIALGRVSALAVAKAFCRD